MKRNHYYPETANAGSGTAGVPFYEHVASHLYAGEAVATALSAVLETARRGATAVNRWRWERTTRNALASLDRATLADIGVARSEIPDIARAAAENPTFTPTRRSLWTA
ncbi:MAG: DUF1127 domain-containing protein [Gammaproteobacteria bacterium]